MRRDARQARTGPQAQRCLWMQLETQQHGVRVRSTAYQLGLELTSSWMTELFTLLEERLARVRLQPSAASVATLPFDFWGGWVGYLGYVFECVVAFDARRADSALAAMSCAKSAALWAVLSAGPAPCLMRLSSLLTVSLRWTISKATRMQ